jgi:hypothetical protein
MLHDQPIAAPETCGVISPRIFYKLTLDTQRTERFDMLLRILVRTSVLLGLALQGCAHVPAYDRELLAHSTMTTSDLARPSEEHVRAVQEGAIGGGVGAGGGCGCN